MLGPAQPDPLRAVATGERRLLRLVGVGPDLEPTLLVRPVEDPLEARLILEPDLDRRQGAQEHLAGRAVQADPVALRKALPVRLGRSRPVVDQQLRAPRDARLADLPSDDGGMGGRAAPGGQDPLRGGHAVEVVRRRLDPDQQHLLPARRPLRRAVRVEDGHPDGGAGRRVQPLGKPRGRLPGGRIELVAQQLVDVRRLDPLKGGPAVDDAGLDHVGGNPDGRSRGPLRAAGLEHVEPAPLDRELEVLDVLVVLLEALADALELGIRLRHLVAQAADRLRRPDPRHDVLALRVGEVLAVEHRLAGVRVAGEGHAGPGIVAHVPEHHGHDVDGRPEVVRDLLVVAVVARALSEPAGEDGLDGEVQLLVRIGRKVPPGVLADDRQERRRDLAQRRRVELRVGLDPLHPLHLVERVIEPLR